MTISVKRLLDSYYSVDDLKDALADIGEPMTGTKDVLINRIILEWPEHNMDLKDLLEYMAPDALEAFCQFYKLDDSGTDETLIRRVVKSNVVEPFPKSRTRASETNDFPSSRVETSQMKSKRPDQITPKPVETSPDRAATTEGRRRQKLMTIYYVLGAIAAAVTIMAYLLGWLSP